MDDLLPTPPASPEPFVPRQVRQWRGALLLATTVPYVTARRPT